MRQTPDRGYSLVELLIVIVITTVIVTVLSNSLLTTLSLNSHFRDRPLIRLTTAGILNVLSKDLGNCVKYQGNSMTGFSMDLPVPQNLTNYLIKKVEYRFGEKTMKRTVGSGTKEYPLQGLSIQVTQKTNPEYVEFQLAFSQNGMILYSTPIRNQNIRGLYK